MEDATAVLLVALLGGLAAGALRLPPWLGFLTAGFVLDAIGGSAAYLRLREEYRLCGCRPAAARTVPARSPDPPHAEFVNQTVVPASLDHPTLDHLPEPDGGGPPTSCDLRYRIVTRIP